MITLHKIDRSRDPWAREYLVKSDSSPDISIAGLVPFLPSTQYYIYVLFGESHLSTMPGVRAYYDDKPYNLYNSIADAKSDIEMFLLFS